MAKPEASEPVRRGPRGARGDIAERILDAARASFASKGYAGSTIQQIAQDAGVNTRLVTYYYSSKEDLLAAALIPPERFLDGIRVATSLPIDERGSALVGSMLASWKDPDIARLLRSALLIAGHEPAALAILKGIFERGILPAVSETVPPEERDVRAALVTTQLLGLGITRYVYCIEQIVDLPESVIVDNIGPTVQRYLAGPIAS